MSTGETLLSGVRGTTSKTEMLVIQTITSTSSDTEKSCNTDHLYRRGQSKRGDKDDDDDEE